MMMMMMIIIIIIIIIIMGILFHCIVLCIVCVCVNVYCTTATGCQPNCD